jgi:hypothetical protein
LAAQPQQYEVEVEWVPPAPAPAPGLVASGELARQLLQHCDVLLKVVDDSAVLLSATERQQALAEYRGLGGGHIEGFVGPKPVTLELKDLRSGELGARPYAMPRSAFEEQKRSPVSGRGSLTTVWSGG